MIFLTLFLFVASSGDKLRAIANAAEGARRYPQVIPEHQKISYCFQVWRMDGNFSTLEATEN